MAQTQYRKPDRAPRALRTTITATLTIMLALVLALGFAIAPGPTQAFADDVPQTQGTPDSPAPVAINKILEVPEDSDPPVVNNFLQATFKFENISKDGATSSAAKALMPSIPNASLMFGAGDLASYTTEDGINTYTKKSPNLLSGVTFSEPGVYVYFVSELGMSATTLAGENRTQYQSRAQYRLTVFVKEGKNSSDTTVFYPAIVTAERIRHDNGDNDNSGTSGVGTKVNPYNIEFTNAWAKTHNDNEDPTDPDTTAITLSKRVAGEFASTSAYFDFSLTVTKPASMVTDAPVTYKAYVVDESNAVVTSAANSSAALSYDATYGDYITITSGVPAQVSLKHNQRLVVTGTHAGTSFTATEAGTANYIPSVVTTVGGTIVGTGSAQVGQSLSTGTPTPWYARGTGVNHMAFTNTADGTSPTGLNTGDIPFLALVLICAGGLAVYFVVALRRRRARS